MRGIYGPTIVKCTYMEKMEYRLHRLEREEAENKKGTDMKNIEKEG